MSDEHARAGETRQDNGIEWGTPEKITAFFCVNLLAAYVPAVVCVMNLGPNANPTLAYLISPVLFAGLITWDAAGYAGGCFCLAALILLLFWASAALRNSWKAWVAIPTLVFVYSLLQGMAAVSALHGIDAIGH